MLPSDYLRLGWCKDRLARNKWGNPVAATSLGAVEWCVIGAFFRAENDGSITDRQGNFLGQRVRVMIGQDSIAEWQNREERSLEEVLAVLQRAEVEVLGS